MTRSIEHSLYDAFLKGSPIGSGCEILEFHSGKRLVAALTKWLHETVPETADLPLAHLHHFYSRDEISRGIDPKWQRLFFELDPSVPEPYAVYTEFVAHLATETVGGDAVFERKPSMRIHIPGRAPDDFRRHDGVLACHHSDLMLGDFFGQFQFWLALSASAGSASMQMVSLPTSRSILLEFSADKCVDSRTFSQSRRDFFDFINQNEHVFSRIQHSANSLSLSPGQVLVFDPRCIHATQENFESFTRVSFDFRMVPLSIYLDGVKKRKSDGWMDSDLGEGRFVPGEFYASKTALGKDLPELFE